MVGNFETKSGEEKKIIKMFLARTFLKNEFADNGWRLVSVILPCRHFNFTINLIGKIIAPIAC
jgi:hypothetical protein